MTPEEKRILLQEISKYVKEHCYYTDGSIKHNDLWLVGWVAEEFNSRKNAMRVLISNEYGLLGNLLNKLARNPDASISRFIDRTDLEVILKAINCTGKDAIARNKLDKDPYAMRLLIEHDRKYAKYVSQELSNSQPFLLSVVHCCPEILKDALPHTFQDTAFALSLLKKNCACLKYLPYRFHNDYQLCLEAARQEGFSLMYIDPAISAQDEIVLAAVSNRGNALSLASPRQKKNRDIVYAAVANCGLALDYADISWKRDYQLVSLAVANRGIALRFAAPELQDCEEIVKTAVENDGYAIRFASERLRCNSKIAAAAIATYPDAYHYLSQQLQNDPEILKLYSLKKEEENKWLQSRMR